MIDEGRSSWNDELLSHSLPRRRGPRLTDNSRRPEVTSFYASEYLEYQVVLQFGPTLR